MNGFLSKLLASFRIPLGTLTFVAFLIVLIEGFVNDTITGLRIFTLIIMGINVIYLVVNKNHPQPIDPTVTPLPPTTTPTNGDSQEA